MQNKQRSRDVGEQLARKLRGYPDLASQKDTRGPCAVCGWALHMAIHNNGDMRLGGKPWAHEYRRFNAE